MTDALPGSPTYDFSGQVALVTGASSGMGLDTARPFAVAVSGIAGRDHDAGVVKGHVEPPESLDGAINERGHLSLVGHVAADAEDLVPGFAEMLSGGLQGVLVDIGENDGGTGSGSTRHRFQRRRRSPCSLPARTGVI
jgi:NAD(P)-dependent dehydrogenase (short-subunit alcohol dehydrogenase family)